MKALGLLLLMMMFSWQSLAARIGKINVADADVYASSSFDADIVANIKKDESFLVSKNLYDGFYKIKLKSGKIGFIPDHEIEINGKSFEAKPYLDEDEFRKQAEKKKSAAQIKLEKKKLEQEAEEADEEEVFDYNLSGVSFQIINLHEETMGGTQVDDLLAVGYKHISDASYEVFAAFKAPKYYAQKTSGSAEGVNIWGLYGINNNIPISAAAALRYGGSVLAHFSKVKVATALKSYDLQDLSVGVVLEGGFLVHFKKAAVDFSLKYFFDRSNYGGLGLSLLF